MAEYVAPGADYSSRLALGPTYTGLVGTVRFRILDNDETVDDPVYGPSTADIIEDPTGSGDYVWNGTAPDNAGKYSPAWDTGPATPLIYDEDLIVTYTAAGGSEPGGRDLCTLDDVLTYLPGYRPNATVETKLQQLITAQSILIMEETGREIVGLNTSARDFDIDRAAAITGRVGIDDLSTLSGATVAVYDDAGDLVETVDTGDLIAWYGAERHGSNGWEPITSLWFRTARGAPNLFPGYTVRVTGTWGFPDIPPFIRQGCAARVLLRYINDVAGAGDDLSDAIDNINLGALFRSSQDAIDALARPVFA
jgi:hypothetical protein